MTDRRDQVDACSGAFNRLVAAMRRGVLYATQPAGEGAEMFWPVRAFFRDIVTDKIGQSTRCAERLESKAPPASFV